MALASAGASDSPGRIADPENARHLFVAARNAAVFLIAAVAALLATRALADPPAPATDNAPARLCGAVEAAARQERLPINFFTRLIWRESAFDSDAVSPAGAEGVAQFMPGAATERGVADPFDPAAAIPASAKLLAELARRFGNLGLAAAAYNAGPDALADWLAGKGVLPLETQDYVLAITGHEVEEWRSANPPSAAAPDPDRPCLASIGDLRRTAFLGSGRLGQHGSYNAIGHRQLLLLAAEANMTVGAYVLHALKERGLEVKSGDRLDSRKARTKRSTSGS
jgi:Transglycosylase SLT domain